jgi:hypothetical protein
MGGQGRAGNDVDQQGVLLFTRRCLVTVQWVHVVQHGLHWCYWHVDVGLTFVHVVGSVWL